MRVIAGRYKGRKLNSPDSYAIRPTSDKAKEALFSILTAEIYGARVLDLFAGTGQLGLEALSRGAASVCFTDSSRKATELIKKNIAVTGFQARSKVLLTDAFSFLASCEEKFDIVFIDPPYEKGMCLRAAEGLSRVLNDNAIVICETRPDETLPERIGSLKAAKEYFYSNIRLTVYRKQLPEENG